MNSLASIAIAVFVMLAIISETFRAMVLSFAADHSLAFLAIGLAVIVLMCTRK